LQQLLCEILINFKRINLIFSVSIIFRNATNAVVKTIGWLFTGSASLFSEAVHSIADTCNQLILTFGLWQSIKKPNPEHP